MKRLFVAAIVAVTIAHPSSAHVIFSNQATFLASVGSYVLDDYNNPGYRNPANNNGVDHYGFTDTELSGVVGETRYTATRHANSNTVYRQSDTSNFWYCSGCNGTFLLTFTSTSVGTPSGVFGVGMSVYSNEDPSFSSNAYVATVTFGDGLTLDLSLPANAPQAGIEEAPFWGITSDTLIQSIHIGLPGSTPTNFGTFIMDNLVVAAPAIVSEPAIPGMMLLGLTLAAIARRRGKTLIKRSQA